LSDVYVTFLSQTHAAISEAGIENDDIDKIIIVSDRAVIAVKPEVFARLRNELAPKLRWTREPGQTQCFFQDGDVYWLTYVPNGDPTELTLTYSSSDN
jgi:hypothetical protein